MLKKVNNQSVYMKLSFFSTNGYTFVIQQACDSNRTPHTMLFSEVHCIRFIF
jgi:hypothetical protein